MNDDRGVTLIELLVALALLSIVSVMAFTFINSGTILSSRATNDLVAENNARLALRTMTQDMRAASRGSLSFSSTSACSTSPAPTPGDCVRFTVSRPTTAHPGCVSTITYGRVGTVIKSTRTDTNCETSQNYSGKTVISGLSSATDPIFSYYTSSGVLLTSNQANAASMLVSFKVRYQNNSPVISFSSFAALRNAR